MIKKHLIQVLFWVCPVLVTAQIELWEPDGPVSAPQINAQQVKEDRAERYQSNGLYGFKNLMTEQVLIQPEYEDIDRVYSDFMVARKNGKTGVLNKKGEVIIPFEFQKIRASSPNIRRRYPFLLAAKNGRWGLIDASGRTIEPFEWVEADYYQQNDSLVLLSKPGLQRLLDRSGKTIIKTNFDGWASSSSLSDKYIYARQKGKGGLIDFRGRVVLPFEFEHVVWVEGMVACVINNNRYGLAAMPDGRIIVPTVHGVIRPKNDRGLFEVNTPDASKHGLVNSTGVFVMPVEYSQIDLTAANSLFIAKNMDSKSAIFDLSGKQLTDFIFQKIITHKDVPDLFFGAVGERQYRLLNVKGALVSQDTFEMVETSPTAFVAAIGWKKAFFRLDGKRVTDFKYAGASGFDSLINRERMIKKYGLPQDRTWIGFASVNGRQIYIDSEGREYSPY